MGERLRKAGGSLISVFAGVASFAFSLWALLVLRTLDEKVLASLALGMFALLICWIAAERPNSEQGRAVAALVKRLLAVRTGDFHSPAPPSVRHTMPALADAVDTLFEQVRINLDHVRALALYDPVTSLPNRVHFKRDGEELLNRRATDEKAAMLFIDLDGFKDVNDNLGHAKGDQVLVMVADRLREVVKAHMPPEGKSAPVIARLAGDEFTLLFPAVADVPAAERIGTAVLNALSEPFQTGSQSVHIGASVGISICPDHADDLPSLMKAADIAMYHAKASGRSQICVYDEPLAVAFAARAETERALRNALRRNEFSLVFQPQLCARSGLPVGGEALLRWAHPEEGTRLPDTFIPIAEESSLILGIGDWVVSAIVEALVRWEAAGMKHRLAFNVSPRQIERAGFFSRLRETVAQSGARLSLLELEFTETMAMRCTDTIIAELAALRADGVAITIDDFGSGYSNLSRIKDMPLDRVKLDRSLIQDVDSSESARTIVGAVIHLIQGLGLEVVAEGVERQAQLDVLRAIGCDTFQGFAFASAMPEEEFIDWIAERERALLPRTA